jgi:2-oxoglutarate dehydrogenase E1 component
LETLTALHAALLDHPADFNPHPKLVRALKGRRKQTDDPTAAKIDWATAEDLAFASILADGVPIRFTGEDVERGTFSHRHALWRDYGDGRVYVPLQNIPQAQAAFEIRNSPLSENAAIGFEFGYNVQAPERLVLWEAQYGDFINGAQAIIDEFVVSGKAKWELTPSLVLLLPHGYEGQGPDHSSARLERFLQMAAKTEIRIVYPTTAAQYFHLLRRQAALLQSDPLPLIVMSPKSLLRHPRGNSTLIELSDGRWQPVITDPLVNDKNIAQVRRLVFCSGKVHLDLVEIQAEQAAMQVAIARLEQLYAFPEAEIQHELARYPHLEEVVWLQEEPANMGAWEFVRWRLEALIDGRWPLRYIGRPRRSSPAEGSSTWHKRNQEAITKHAFVLTGQEKAKNNLK